jgi:microcystin-dependent protein
MWVYYSFLNNSNVTEYKSRILSYDLQLNVWLLTVSDAGLIIGNTIKSGTVRTSGLTTGDLTNYTKIFEVLPETPVFSTDTASSSGSLNNLKTTYATSQSIASNSLEIYKIWCRSADAEEQFVKCVVYLSITTVNGSIVTKTYKTFIVNYNNDTNTWSIPDPLVQTTSTETDDKFSIIISGENIADYFMFYSIIVLNDSVKTTLVEKDKITYNRKLIQQQKLPRIGSVVMWAGVSPPDGAKLCDGSQYNKATYPELFKVIGNMYGGTDPLFNVPDFRNVYLFGSSSPIQCSSTLYGSWAIQNFSHFHMLDVTNIRYISSEANTIEPPDSSTSNAYHFNGVADIGMTVKSYPDPAVTKESYRPNYTLCNYIIYHD